MAFKFYQTRPNMIKYDQTRSNSTTQGVQTVKCLLTKQCFMVFGRQTFLICPGPYLFGRQTFLICPGPYLFGRQTFSFSFFFASVITTGKLLLLKPNEISQYTNRNNH